MASSWSGKHHPSVLLENQQGKAWRRNGAEVEGKAVPVGTTKEIWDVKQERKKNSV